MLFVSRQFAAASKRAFSTSSYQNAAKVAVLGAAGGIGQPLSLLLKANPTISHLSLYDLFNTPGVAADLSHINTPAKVTGHLPDNDGLKHALTDADIVVIPAGVPRKPGMSRDDLFNTNAGIVRDLATACAQYCPKAHILVIANPVNSTVPIVAEVFKKFNVFDPRRVFGVTTLDVVRASRFVSENQDSSPLDTKITVVGGHSGVTIIPVFSQTPGLQLNESDLKALTHRVQFGGDEVVKAKNGGGSATLSMAYAGARFTNSLLDATVNGVKGITEPTYVKSDVLAKDGVEYFSTQVELGPHGVEKINGLGELTAYEQELLQAAIPELKKNIQKGFDFVHKE
ncbi:Malate dehydrogenase, cytoplasmic [Dimargaris cristalligena]|uniref:Malate dehydrogenase n=1 Tax=Dimargaris cristalligena TaxID=215637 RepID=A0A4P9ZY76_9FUNG|nr:Malate dehydrogenase, cytoplasmic [Dimargaris cristalligena]RKP37720.1 malate dehydrogenase, NAD-dependent [Dimargaris cristalligena]|eukprot:RKP37720.1 malate dehydrogenase, NAD-dependent [Dimargaris cristalligena]